MKDEFVPYEIALAMKELGFDERCYAYYSTHHSVPTFHSYYPSGLDNESKWNDDVTIVPLYQQAFDYLMSFLEDEDFLIFYKNGNVDIALKKPEVIECEDKDACLRKLIEIVRDESKGV